jgi:putative membrane protein
MKYLKVLGLVALFFFSMLFFVQNHDILIQELALELKVFGLHYATEAAPFYLIILMAFVIGSLLCTLYFFLERVRLSKQARQLRKQVDALEKEVASLRPKTMDDSYTTTESTENVQN